MWFLYLSRTPEVMVLLVERWMRHSDWSITPISVFFSQTITSMSLYWFVNWRSTIFHLFIYYYFLLGGKPDICKQGTVLWGFFYGKNGRQRLNNKRRFWLDVVLWSHFGAFLRRLVPTAEVSNVVCTGIPEGTGFCLRHDASSLVFAPNSWILFERCISAINSKADMDRLPVRELSAYSFLFRKRCGVCREMNVFTEMYSWASLFPLR